MTSTPEGGGCCCHGNEANHEDRVERVEDKQPRAETTSAAESCCGDSPAHDHAEPAKAHAND